MKNRMRLLDWTFKWFLSGLRCLSRFENGGSRPGKLRLTSHNQDAMSQVGARA
jgi:hypothetical protein